MGFGKRIAAAAAAVVLLLSAGTVTPLHSGAAETMVYPNITGLPFENGDPFKGVDVSSVK